jgi:hypothetical protein
MNHLMTSIVQSSVPGVTPTCLDDGLNPAFPGLACPKYALWDSNPGSWLAKEQTSRLRFGGRRLVLLNDEAWRCHPCTQTL